MKTLSLCAGLLILLATAAYAQQAQPPADQSDSAMLLQKVRELEDRVIALEGQVRLLKSQQAAAPAPSAPTPAEAAGAPAPAPSEAPATQTAALAQAAQPVQLGGAGGSAAKVLNPDISVIGDFIGAAGHNPVSPSPAFEMHESELGLQAIIDPYARGDFFLSFGEEGVNLEEGYITFTALPAGFVAKVGKMRSAFGKVNTFHNHVLSWVDRPLVTNNLVGGQTRGSGLWPIPFCRPGTLLLPR